MRIKLLKPYQLLVPGEITDCIDSIAIELIKRGVAEAVVVEKAEFIAISSGNTHEIKIEADGSVKKKRGRPRKI